MKKSGVKLTVIIAVKNEIDHIQNCLHPILGWSDQIIIADSTSTDGTKEYALSKDVEYFDFKWNGKWPKKRQYVLDNCNIIGDWILMLDADEFLSDTNKKEIDIKILNNNYGAYQVPFNIIFLNKKLRFGDSTLYKMALFRNNQAKYMRKTKIDENNLDMEVHEHVGYFGELKVGKLKNGVAHHSVHSIYRLLNKYNDYSNWEVNSFLEKTDEIIKSKENIQSSFRSRLKKAFLLWPFSDSIYFAYMFFINLGFLDGIEGYYRAKLQSQQIFKIKLKIFEKNKDI